MAQTTKASRASRQRAPKVTQTIDIRHHLPYLLVVLANGLALHAYRQYQTQFGLRAGDWRIMSTLGHFGPISYNELAARIGMDRAGISRTIASLVRRRYI